MKMSNFLLSIVAIFAISATISASKLIISKNSTSVSYIPTDEKLVGGGLSIEMPSEPTSRQASLLALAYKIAERDGHRYPELLQGILLQESRAGELDSYKVAGQEFGLSANQRYYGIGQIKLAAARDVLSQYPEMWQDFAFHTRTDEEIIAKLIENDEFNISVASKYLLILSTYGFTTPQQLAIAYNRGPGGARSVGPSTDYSIKVMNHISTIRYNQYASRGLNNRG